MAVLAAAQQLLNIRRTTKRVCAAPGFHTRAVVSNRKAMKIIHREYRAVNSAAPKQETGDLKSRRPSPHLVSPSSHSLEKYFLAKIWKYEATMKMKSSCLCACVSSALVADFSCLSCRLRSVSQGLSQHWEMLTSPPLLPETFEPLYRLRVVWVLTLGVTWISSLIMKPEVSKQTDICTWELQDDTRCGPLRVFS